MQNVRQNIARGSSHFLVRIAACFFKGFSALRESNFILVIDCWATQCLDRHVASHALRMVDEFQASI